MNRINTKKMSLAISIIIFACAIFAWEFLVQYNSISSFIFPAPTAIIKVLFTDFPIIAPHLFTTLLTTISGIIIALVCALVLSIVMDIAPIIKYVLYPIILVFQIVPIIVFAPIFIIWLGYGIPTQLVTIILMVFFSYDNYTTQWI